MSINLAAKVKGLSEPAFRERFGTEEQCLALLFEMRWGEGFTCERCGGTSYARMKCRKQVQCNRCKHQVGFTAGTVFHSTIDRRRRSIRLQHSARQETREGCR